MLVEAQIQKITQLLYAVTKNGVSFFKGIGELPFVQQATFSIWESEDDINNFAYSNTSHKNIVSKTKKQKWYKEDLFARFHICLLYTSPSPRDRG